ncbi:acyl-ACP--UDP-N-acetylglucosamine O-acyltransferase [Thiomicrorhabdus sp.]|uniref:acyl-ACP--UDP-N-acetylglucosamine O-acyltransferase n=1 Tax=Thiomicrorhabdus sp. TaxID=2039724 RepID=UPI0029C7DE5D|nr:acyl-ACP--UDP-N-acetylglucosamine O-acyltransferase [Thiomicrorhabdus sp.]
MIHPTAIIDPKANVAEGVKIGPYCVIEGDVTLGEGCILDSHVVIQGPTVIGKNNRFYPFGCIGAAPQDKKYRDEPTLLIIGDGNTFRENVTVNRGTVQDIGKTVIGNGNWIMAGVHIAHDCIVGNNCIFANAAALAGHVIVEDWAILGGYSLIHQFCRIGAHSFCGMGSVINQDVPNFVVVSGNLAQARGINLEGMKRRGFDSDQLRLVKNAYRSLYRSGMRLSDSIEALRSLEDDKHTLSPLIHFLEESKRGIVR